MLKTSYFSSNKDTKTPLLKHATEATLRFMVTIQLYDSKLAYNTLRGHAWSFVAVRFLCTTYLALFNPDIVVSSRAVLFLTPCSLSSPSTNWRLCQGMWSTHLFLCLMKFLNIIGDIRFQHFRTSTASSFLTSSLLILYCTVAGFDQLNSLNESSNVFILGRFQAMRCAIQRSTRRLPFHEA